MSFRLRPSSKRSTDTEHSLVQFSKPQQTFISNEVMTLKNIMNKLQMLETNVLAMNDNFRKDKEISNAGYIQVQKRLDVIQYKEFANEKDIRQIQEINKESFSPLPPLKSESNGIGKNQIVVLKQTLLQERQGQKEQIKHMSAIMEQMSMKQLRLEQELREAFNCTKEDYQSRISDQTDEMRKVDQMKMRKVDQQYEIIKDSMVGVQKRIYEELEAKMRKQTIIKDYVHEKVGEMKEEIAQEQKQVMVTEAKIARQTKQSLESLYSMIGQMKSSFSEQLTETQTLSVNNLKRMSMNMDILSEKMAERIRNLEEESKESSNEIVQFRQWVVNKLDENREIVMSLEEDAIERVEGKGGNQNQGGGPGGAGLFKIDEKISLMQKDISQWKFSTQQKNLSIFKEISQTLKHMKVDFKKQNDQFSSQLISLTESLKSIKKSLPSDMKKISQSIVTIFNDEFDVLAEQLDLITEMIKVSKAEGEKHTKDEIKRSREEYSEEVKAMIASSRKEQSLAVEKMLIKNEESQKTALQKESSYVQSLLNQKIEALQSAQRDLESNSKKINMNTNSQLEGFTHSLKQFNERYKEYLEEQRKDDLKKRIDLQESMRKNASNLMEISYKKSEFLVEGMKNAIEMNYMKERLSTKQQFQGIKDEIKKNTQSEKENVVNAISELKANLNSEREVSEQVFDRKINDHISNLSKSMEAEIKKVNGESQALEENLNENINTLKKSIGMQMGNNKLEIDEKLAENQMLIEEKLTISEEDVSSLRSQLEEMKQKEAEEREKLKKGQEEGILTAIHELEVRIDDTEKKLANQSSSENLKNTVRIEEIEKKIANSERKVTEEMNANILKIQKQIKEMDNEAKKQSEQIKKQREENSALKGEKDKLQGDIEKEKEEGEKNGKFQIQMLEEQTKRIQLLEDQLKREMGNQVAEMTEKNEDSLKDMDETLTSLRESVWKIEAMSFSEQAKNKALFDRVNEDLGTVALNLEVISKQLKVDFKKGAK